MQFRRFLCQSPADQGFSFPEWQGFAYTAWAYSFQPERLVDTVWVRCEVAESGEVWTIEWILSESDTLEFRRLARLAKDFRNDLETSD